MAEKIKKSESQAQQEPAQAQKKQYEPPKVVSHHQMEVIAGTCDQPSGGKTQPIDCGFSFS